ncbi:hypothetical protein [Konateibacter massiliensis]|uniref:hypothetical protein n=1 Tax=Konateibacter massiliensis TaxID=2002841 RepID=UPI000C15D4F9|nr:hypothetical protein [Konateibacter massiliensis]
MEINHQQLHSYLLYDSEIPYNENIVLSPIRMKNILLFQQCQSALTLRKDSIFQEKELIKMSYFEFIKYAHHNFELASKYEVQGLDFYYDLILNIFRLACVDAEIAYAQNHDITINGQIITDEIFDDLRKVILIQNDIDFDVDEFMNIETIKALEKAREFEAKKNKEKADIEDYIDSLVIGLKVTEEYISNLSIRKFWRYIKRINKHENYQTSCTAKMSGMVTLKEPIQHWMTSIEVEDKYANLKTDEDELRGKVG